MHQVAQQVAADITQLVQKLIISLENTTVIGDYVTAAFTTNDGKWLVQSHGTATFQSVIKQIAEQQIVVDKRYVFLVLGHNQLRSVTRSLLLDFVYTLVANIRHVNQQARIYFNAVLPRPIDNDEVKLILIGFNRWLATAVNKAGRVFGRVHFLPVQHAFINEGIPIQQLFDDDGFTISHLGASLLRRKMFELAGFHRNIQ